MKTPTTIKPKSTGFYLAFLVIVCLGSHLRLDQFTLQVLLDDEWHVIHQLLARSPQELLQSFGRSDFSIPLALLYWVQLKLVGLSELGMRWPMMLAGVVTMILFPLYLRKFFGDKTVLIFTFMLAISPSLILYSRMARPYALTLLLSVLAVGLFRSFAEAESASWKVGLSYLFCAVTSAWLHAISLPLIVAPFLVYGVAALAARDLDRLKRLFLLGLVTSLGLLLVVLPPMLGNQEYLLTRFGLQAPGFQAYYGMLYFWAGTDSSSVVVISLVLAIIGAGLAWRNFPLISSLLVGLGLTLAAILLIEPAGVQNPGTLMRYLLPALPLFLLLVSIGITTVGDSISENWGLAGQYTWSMLMLSVFLLLVYHSPLLKTLVKPNSNTLHSVYRFDYRERSNLIYQYQKDFPVSPLWGRLAEHPRDSIKLAAAPFSFETYHWDAARWEQISRQRVMPGYISGVCVTSRWGEVPNGEGYRFKNVGYLADQNDLIERGFDLVVYQKPNAVLTNQGNKMFGMKTAHCEQKLRESYPPPLYEDQWLVVFTIPKDEPGQSDVER